VDDPVLLRYWSAPGPEGFGTCVSYVLRTTAGWIFLDPLRPSPENAGRLQRLIRERPVAVVLTSDGHERFAQEIRQQWGTPVWGPVLGEAQRDAAYDVEPDHFYKEGDDLPGGLRAIKLAGAWRGDHALLWDAPTSERVLFSGDILNGQAEPETVPEDHYRRSPGLEFGARPAYVERHDNPAALKASLERLAREDFDLICGSHARPFRDGSGAALERLIKTIRV
ncbi:MAG TPA: MBL fold metallo-hydrolase, partial [Chloroflexota bacterium]|nr:MBL fold metallo-hydrolase [Chloroflexota bacterium]